MTEITDEILYHFLQGEATDEELAEIIRRTKETPENAEALFDMERVSFLTRETADPEGERRDMRQALMRVMHRIGEEESAALRRRRRRLMLWWSTAAAVAVILVVAGIGLFRGGQSEPEMLRLATNEAPLEFVLPDSTKIWLNKNTVVEYPENFAENRCMTLKGEAYFEVNPDTAHPFTVDGPYLNVRVLGTKFTFRTGTPAAESFVSLVKGSVKVSDTDGDNSIVLSPGQKATYSASTRRMKVIDTQPEIDAVWHDNNIPFNNATIRDIARTLSQVFEVEITVSDNVDARATYSGVALSCGTIDSTLKALCNTLPIKYTVKNKKVHISSTK